MSDAEESPAQRQARIRRQKREAKINANAQERLDKITQLSGRTPESVRRQTAPSTPTPGTPTPATSVSREPSPLLPTPPSGQPSLQSADAAQQAEAQQQLLRAFLQAAGPGAAAGAGAGAGAGGNNATLPGQPQPGLADSDDPLRKMLASMMAGGAAGAAGAGGSDPNAAPAPDVNFSPDDVARATGLPPFLAKALLGGVQATAPPTPEEVRRQAIWRAVHLAFALLAAIYLVFSIDTATASFGENPPAPATLRNPFSVFLIGELVLHTASLLLAGASGKAGVGLLLQTAKDLATDAALSVFLLGLATWWKGGVA